MGREMAGNWFGRRSGRVTQARRRGKLCRMESSGGVAEAHYHGPAARAPARAASARALAAAGLMSLLVLLAGCAAQHPRAHAGEAGHRIAPIAIVDVAAADPQRANAVLIRAIGLVGVRYVRGGNTPDTGFDCSGLVNFVFRDMEIGRASCRERV